MSITAASLKMSCRSTGNIITFIFQEIWSHMLKHKTQFIVALLLMIILTVIAATVEGTKWLTIIAWIIGIAIILDLLIIIFNLIFKD
jgi:hypothetical protein